MLMYKRQELNIEGGTSILAFHPNTEHTYPPVIFAASPPTSSPTQKSQSKSIFPDTPDYATPKMPTIYGYDISEGLISIAVSSSILTVRDRLFGIPPLRSRDDEFFQALGTRWFAVQTDLLRVPPRLGLFSPEPGPVRAAEAYLFADAARHVAVAGMAACLLSTWRRLPLVEQFVMVCDALFSSLLGLYVYVWVAGRLARFRHSKWVGLLLVVSFPRR